MRLNTKVEDNWLSHPNGRHGKLCVSYINQSPLLFVGLLRDGPFRNNQPCCFKCFARRYDTGFDFHFSLPPPPFLNLRPCPFRRVLVCFESLYFRVSRSLCTVSRLCAGVLGPKANPTIHIAAATSPPNPSSTKQSPRGIKRSRSPDDYTDSVVVGEGDAGTDTPPHASHCVASPSHFIMLRQ